MLLVTFRDPIRNQKSTTGSCPMVKRTQFNFNFPHFTMYAYVYIQLTGKISYCEVSNLFHIK